MKAPDGNKLAILERLNQGRFLSGQVLGDELGISRAAVAKHIHSLQEMGIDIYKVNGKGYRISRPLSLLSQPAITEVYEQYKGRRDASKYNRLSIPPTVSLCAVSRRITLSLIPC